MKKHLVSSLAAAAVLSFAGAAHAQAANPSAYFELGYASLSYKGSFGSDTLKASPGVLTGTLGYKLHPNIALEGQLGFGLGSSEVKLNGAGTGFDAKIGTGFGVFVRPSVEVAQNLELFGRLGWQRTKLKISGGIPKTSSHSDMAFGLGANYSLSKTSYLQANWMNYYSKDGETVRGFGLSYGMRF